MLQLNSISMRCEFEVIPGRLQRLADWLRWLAVVVLVKTQSYVGEIIQGGAWPAQW
jgi:hypothetical protein